MFSLDIKVIIANLSLHAGILLRLTDEIPSLSGNCRIDAIKMRTPDNQIRFLPDISLFMIMIYQECLSVNWEML